MGRDRELCSSNCSVGNCFARVIAFFFGLWLAFVGLSKWINGVDYFIGYIEKEFAATFLPHLLVLATAWIIAILEPLCGLWLLSGKWISKAFFTTGCLMFLLTIGKTILRDYATVANNWQYVVLCFVCFVLSKKKDNKQGSK